MTRREEYVRILAALIHSNACGTLGTPEKNAARAMNHLRETNLHFPETSEQHPEPSEECVPLYQVLLETAGAIVSFEVATADSDAVVVATQRLSDLLPEGAGIHLGGYAEIGKRPIRSGIVSFKVTRGSLPLYK